MVNTTSNSTNDKVSKLKQLKRKRKVKTYKSTSNYYDKRNNKIFKFEEDLLLKMPKVLAKFIMKCSCFLNFYKKISI